MAAAAQVVMGYVSCLIDQWPFIIIILLVGPPYSNPSTLII